MAEGRSFCSEYTLGSKSSPWKTKMQPALISNAGSVMTDVLTGRTCTAFLRTRIGCTERERREVSRFVHVSCIKTLMLPVSVGGLRMTPREMWNYALII